MSVRWNTLDGDTAQDNADYRRDQENAAREDARNHWGGFDPMDDGRDEPPPEPAPTVPEEFRQRCQQIQAEMAAQQRRRRL